MSYDVRLTDPVSGKTIKLFTPHHMAGGTVAVGGTKELWLNVTYNYHEHLRRLDPDQGIRWLYGKTGVRTIPALERAINKLGNNTDEDYWKPTEGNVKRALCQLLAMAQMRPDGVWKGD